MAQQHTIGSNNTTVTNVKGDTIVVYHETAVVVFNDKTITLDTGGWFTKTTKTRMMQASNQFDLGFTISTKGGTWFVDFKGTTVEFNGNVVELAR